MTNHVEPPSGSRQFLRKSSDARKAIDAAITFGYGSREPGWYGDGIHRKSLSREVELVYAEHFQPDWVWGREYWMARKPKGPDLIAWTVDKGGRIVRGWRRNRWDRAADTVYHPHGDRFCPIEAAWLPLVRVGEISFPAYPFLAVAPGSTDPEAIATVRRLNALRSEAVA